jgi:hypothetical protein
VSGQEVGVEMGLKDTLDAEASPLRFLEIHPDVASRIDHDGPPGRLVADQIRRVRQAAEIVLSEDHPCLRL